MRAKTIILSILLLFGSNATAQRVETVGGFTFIQHDSIQMHSVDSVMVHFPVYFHDGREYRRFIWGDFDSTIIRSVKTATRDLTQKLFFSPTIFFTDYYLTALTSNPIWQDFYSGTYSQCFRFISHCHWIGCINYRTIIDGDTITIGSSEKFREIFAPVESAQQAIAFAHIFTQSFPIFNLDFLRSFHSGAFEELTEKPRFLYFERQDTIQTILESGKTQIDIVVRKDTIIQLLLPPSIIWEVYLPEIETTFVEITDEGYKLLLFYQSRGASPSFSGPFMKRLIKVTFDGQVRILEQTKAFGNLEDRRLYGW